MIFFYNSLHNKKVSFNPIDSTNIKMYICGPTIYNKIHIGNARSFVVFDSIYRILSHYYPKVTFIRNITDVDDKIINKAKQDNISIYDLTQKTLIQFEEDLKKLNCISPNKQPKATDHILDMIDMIDTLIKKDVAYITKNNVFFNIRKVPHYGKLSGINLNKNHAGKRIEVNPDKKNPEDFTLWKNVNKAEQGWESPWGYGRPGWHIECSTMSKKYLGPTFDIHGGGKDLTFPHHENEIAQSECANDTRMANYWLHVNMLSIKGEKMSKSVGNIITIDDLINKYQADTIRLVFFSTHYRKMLDFDYEKLQQYEKFIVNTYKLLNSVKNDNITNNINEDFVDALYNDFNTPKALSILYSIIKEFKLNPSIVKKSIIINCGYLLGIFQNSPSATYAKKNKLSTKEIENLIQQRNEYKNKNDYTKADKIRNTLKENNVILKDTVHETTWEYEK